MNLVHDNDVCRLLPLTRSEKINNFLNILRSSDYYNDTIQAKHLEWLFEAEVTAEFVDWLCTYIGPENICKQEEIDEYLELTAQCTGTSDFFPLNESLLHDVSPVAEEVTHKTLVSLEEEILEVDTFLSVLNTQQENLRYLKEPFNKEVHEFQERYKSVQKCLLSAEHTCISLSKKLDSTYKKAVECIQPTNTVFQNSLSGENEESQLPLHRSIKDLKAKYDRFGQHISLITSRNLEQHLSHKEGRSDDLVQQMTVYNDTSIQLMNIKYENTLIQPKKNGITEARSNSIDTSSQFITNKMKKHLRTRAQYWKKAITAAKYKCLMEELEKQENLSVLGEIVQLTKSIEAGLFQPSQTKLRVQLVNFQDKIEHFHQMSLNENIMIYIAQFANAHVMQVFYNLSEKVKHHHNKTFECQQMLLRCTESQFCHSYLFFLLMVIEKLKLEDITQLSHNFSQPLYEDLKELSIRREKMKMIRVEYDARCGKELCVDHSLLKTLFLLAPPKTPYQQLFDTLKKIDDSVHKEEYELFKMSFHMMEETFNENIQSLQELEKVLFTGTTKKPLVMDLDLSCQLYEIEIVVKELQEKLKKTIEDCAETKKLISKKPFKYRRLLWVYFLTNYKKIIELIDGMEHKVLQMNKE